MASFEDVRRILLAFPGVEESTWWGTPGFKARGKGWVRLRSEDARSEPGDADTLVVTKVELIEREMLMARDPAAFYFTPHYANYPSVLVRLSKVRMSDLEEVLELSWRRAEEEAASRPRRGSRRR